jgi:hypothetical protein
MMCGWALPRKGVWTLPLAGSLGDFKSRGPDNFSGQSYVAKRRDSYVRPIEWEIAMRFSTTQAIVLGASVAILLGSVGGMVMIARNPPQPEARSTKSFPQRKKAYVDTLESEMRPKKIEAELPKPTDRPPLAAEGSAASNKVIKTEKASAAMDDDASDDPNSMEALASAKLKEAKGYREQKNKSKAKECCEEIIKKYPLTKSAEEAVLLMNELN